VELCDRAVSIARAAPRTGRSFRLVGELLFVLAMAAHQEGVPGADALLQRMEDIARLAYGEDVEFMVVLGQLAENRWRLRQYREGLEVANELLAFLSRHDLSAHWLLVQATRIRGLCLLALGEVAKGETELLLLRDRLLPFRATGNAQVRAGIEALPESVGTFTDAAQLNDFLRGSFGRWVASRELSGLASVWWPTALDEPVALRLCTAALAIVEQPNSPLPAATTLAFRGALLLRLGRAEAALPLLEGAAANTRAPSPESLADLVIVRWRTGDIEAADRALAQLRREAEGAREARLRWQLALARATSARR
jgi:hypothetical protein